MNGSIATGWSFGSGGLRLLVSSGLVSAWLGLLLTGALPALVSHLFLALALVVYPWRSGPTKKRDSQ